jgi:hypothetical protein
LFDQLGLPSGEVGKKHASTKEEVLLELQGRHPVVPLLLRHRALNKLKTTYIDALVDFAVPATATTEWGRGGGLTDGPRFSIHVRAVATRRIVAIGLRWRDGRGGSFGAHVIDSIQASLNTLFKLAYKGCLKETTIVLQLFLPYVIFSNNYELVSFTSVLMLFKRSK